MNADDHAVHCKYAFYKLRDVWCAKMTGTVCLSTFPKPISMCKSPRCTKNKVLPVIEIGPPRAVQYYMTSVDLNFLPCLKERRCTY